MMAEQQIKELIGKVKKNKKYSSISEEIIKKEVENYFKINPKNVIYLDRPRSEKYNQIVKAVRAKLHLIHGSFKKDADKREVYLKHIYGINDYKNHDKILLTSVSSKERLKDYGELYKKIFSIAGKPKSILDLGCGLNPVSYPYMGISHITYYAYDIDKKDIDFLSRYFKFMGIKGKSKIADLRDIKEIKKLPKADICFMFKLLDPLEQKGHKLSEEIIKALKCRYIIVSFSTKTISGKPMNHPYRGWIERMLERINLKFEKILTENEVYYVIKKQY